MGVRKYVDAYAMSRDELRTLLYDRQQGLCGICEGDLPKGFLHSQHVNIDHTVPRSHGGPDEVSNLTLAHKACNLTKGDMCPGCQRCIEEPEAEED